LSAKAVEFCETFLVPKETSKTTDINIVTKVVCTNKIKQVLKYIRELK